MTNISGKTIFVWPSIKFDSVLTDFRWPYGRKVASGHLLFLAVPIYVAFPGRKRYFICVYTKHLGKYRIVDAFVAVKFSLCSRSMSYREY